MTRSRFSIPWFMLGMLGLMPSLAEAQIPTSLGDSELECSIFESGLLNAESIQSGDVLIRLDSSLDTVRREKDTTVGVTVDQTQYVRCVFDISQQRYLMASRSEQKILDMADFNEEFSNSETKPPSGWTVDFAKKQFLHDQNAQPEDWGVFGNRQPARCLKMLDYWDPRTAGLHPSSDPVLMDDVRSYVLERAAGTKFLDRRYPGEFRVRLRLFDGQYVDGCDRETFDFDEQTSMPVGFQLESWHAGDRKWYPQGKATFKWKFMDGVHVPVECSFEKTEGVQSADGKLHYGTEITTVRLHWYSVNQKLPDSKFEGSQVQSINQLLNLLDPQQATTFRETKSPEAKEKQKD